MKTATWANGGLPSSNDALPTKITSSLQVRVGVLKYDQWSHHWECVLTALQKCKADSNDYDYTTDFLPHTNNPITTRIGNEPPKPFLLTETATTHRQRKAKKVRALGAQHRAKGVVLGLPLESKYN